MNMILAAVPELLLVELSLDEELLWLEDILGSNIRGHITVRRGKTEAMAHLLDPQEPLPAVIVLDNRPPKLSGIEILNRLRDNDRTRRVPIVLFGGINVDDEPADLYPMGARIGGARMI